MKPKERLKQTELSKREWFAAMAMQGLLASDAKFSTSPETIAEMAVDQADELLEELKEGKSP